MRSTIGLLASVLSLSSCITVVNTPGPHGLDGHAFFGVSWEHHPPYSYWDNNHAIPYNPELGLYYPTIPGVYEFEYFINPEEYWYGTYEMWIDPGGPGGSYGEHGIDGADTYLMLICDPNGYHEHRDGTWKATPQSDGYRIGQEPLVIEERFGDRQYKITIQKTHIDNRPAQDPKYRSE